MRKALTTEWLKKGFKNNFDLCRKAIEIGRYTVLHHPHSTLQDVLTAVEDLEQNRENG